MGLSPVQKSFRISTTNSNNLATKTGIPRVDLPPRCGNPIHTGWLLIGMDWLRLMEPAGGEGCPSGQGRGCAVHGEVKALSRDQAFFHLCNSIKPGTKAVIPLVDTAPHDVETPT